MRNPSKGREWVYSSKRSRSLLHQVHLSENCSPPKGEETFFPPPFMWHWCVLKCMGKVCSLFPPKGPSPPGILMNKLIRIKSIMRITNDTNLQICWQLWPHPSPRLLVAHWSDQAKEFNPEVLQLMSSECSHVRLFPNWITKLSLGRATREDQGTRP